MLKIISLVALTGPSSSQVIEARSIIQAVMIIGKKTAERLVLELREALGASAGSSAPLPYNPSSPTNVSDALSALVALGVKPADADKAVRLAVAKLGEDANAEELIKLSLSAK